MSYETINGSVNKDTGGSDVRYAALLWNDITPVPPHMVALIQFAVNKKSQVLYLTEQVYSQDVPALFAFMYDYLELRTTQTVIVDSASIDLVATLMASNALDPSLDKLNFAYDASVSGYQGNAAVNHIMFHDLQSFVNFRALKETTTQSRLSFTLK